MRGGTVSSAAAATGNRNPPDMKRHAMKALFLAGAAAAGMISTPAASAADLNKTVETCASCHGSDGASVEPDVPTIAGYSAEYISDEMAAYRKNERPCRENDVRSGSGKGTKSDMCRVAKDLGESDIEQVAKYFARKKFARTPQTFDSALAAKGKEIHDANCDKCHLDSGTVADDDAGILAGQRMQYLRSQFEDFKAGKRKMPQRMKPRIDKLEKEDIEALLNFYGSFK
jgi:cytochrome subunit of sulfide dehydrogenase